MLSGKKQLQVLEPRNRGTLDGLPTGGDTEGGGVSIPGDPKGQRLARDLTHRAPVAGPLGPTGTDDTAAKQSRLQSDCEALNPTKKGEEKNEIFLHGHEEKGRHVFYC